MGELDAIISLKRCPVHMPEDWTPPVPAFSANIDADLQFTSLFVGVQRPTPDSLWAVNALFAKSSATAVEHAEFVDRAGDRNHVFIAYFAGANAYDAWRNESGFDDVLKDEKHLTAEYGLWAETFTYAKGQFETLFSTPDSLEGVGRFAADTVGPIREHAYWGGAEDRIPNATKAGFKAGLNSMPQPEPAVTRGRRIPVTPPNNLCLIRSGQDLRSVRGDERRHYDAYIEPALREGLDYLANASESGCFDSRYMRHCTQDGNPVDKTFGMQMFLSIQQLMDWAKSHPTHLKIFNQFQAMAERMQGQFDLRLWHEVAVMAAGDASAVYVNCNERTGFLPFAHAFSAD